MTMTVLTYIYTVVCTYLFIHGVCTLNLTSCKTPLLQRLGYAIFTVGVFATLIGPYFGSYYPRMPDVLVITGLAMYNTYRTFRIWKRGWHNAELKIYKVTHDPN